MCLQLLLYLYLVSLSFFHSSLSLSICLPCYLFLWICRTILHLNEILYLRLTRICYRIHKHEFCVVVRFTLPIICVDKKGKKKKIKNCSWHSAVELRCRVLRFRQCGRQKRDTKVCLWHFKFSTLKFHANAMPTSLSLHILVPLYINLITSLRKRLLG